MKTSQDTPAYEVCREWALHPWLPRPPGVAHLVRGGIITWVRQTQPPLGPPPLEMGAPDPACPVAPALLTLMAAMIAEVSGC
jgi:hypothetical protein